MGTYSSPQGGDESSDLIAKNRIKIPLYWVEVDPSMAGLPRLNLRALLVGTMTADGTAEPNVQRVVGQQIQADALFGMGSELSRMVKAFFSNQ